MHPSRLLISVLLLLGPIAAIRPAAAWPHDPTNGNVPLCAATGNQYFPASVPDGAGGAIVAWFDQRSGSFDIYAQRISAAGAPLWTVNGVALCTATGDQQYATIASDGAGGAIVTWQDQRGGACDIYAQRIGASGAPMWTAGGVALCTSTGDQQHPTIVSDGAGGAIVTWYDQRSGTSDIYAQGIDASGAVQWKPSGVALCTAANDQLDPRIASDGAGGAIVTWYDYRSGTTYDVYAQRISAVGVVQWTANGVALCTAANSQYFPAIVADGEGGAIVTWHDYRFGISADIYAQRIDDAGAAQWKANGVALCTAANDQYDPMIASDGASGAIVTWSDYRAADQTVHIYAGRISATGVALWTANGVGLCTLPGDQIAPRIVSDDAGGAIVAWCDYRTGSANSDVYTQRISATGAVQWTADGVALCTATGEQFVQTLVPDGAGGAIVTWHDFRSGTSYDIYAQRIELFGKPGSPEPAIVSVLDVPNDQGGHVRLGWDASYLDLESDPDLTAYDIFRSVPPLVAQDAIARGASRQLRLGEVPAAGERAHLFTVSGTQQLSWEYVNTVSPRHVLATYHSTQATTRDSVAGSNPATSFMVVGRNDLGSRYWSSEPAAGYSVDNLAPAAPAPFTGEYAAGTTSLHWSRNTESDLAGYELYRGTSTTFTPGPSHLVSALADTGYADAAGAPYIYKLTAIDSHGNESPVATLIPGGTLGVGDAVPAGLSFAAPSPNPARGATTLDYTLSRVGHVRLAVFDAAGRRVRVLREGELAAGAHRESFSLRDEAGRGLASGLYVVRLEAEGRVLTRRLAAIR